MEQQQRAQNTTIYQELYDCAQEADITRAQDVINRGKEIRIDFWELLPGRLVLRNALACASAKGCLPFVKFMCENTSVTPHTFPLNDLEYGRLTVDEERRVAQSPLIMAM